VARGAELVRTARSVNAKEACEWGFAYGAPVADPVAAAKALISEVLAGKSLPKLDEGPVAGLEALGPLDIGHRSLAIDAIVVDVLRRGLALPLKEGLALEAKGFARCKQTVDMDVGMKNFMQNGPRVPAAFLHE
jgi:enoyl-CoA hydratase / 3-hydroxyacyl-CoA dehydrogenase